ncbi:nitronate monooxygenase [Actinoplanes italicus]|uniref:Probable nitronate monooxygenase n=1 Tax=Actinoplanes italicus TaxID=113567 RepID=A0A2T0K7D0_9ACTN|nr:nitronate monooxygenase [Actinoplanes italicus]PRX18905.1 nitronate monooxygenase [Actinoplanes italicus]GIE32518.1 nitronate monooxygenase [Actinoplanes italicus]
MSDRLTRLLGIEHGIVQGPFGGGLSSVPLAAAVSAAGGLGSFGANHLTPDGITALVGELRAAVPDGLPFNVNLWVPHPGEQDLRPTAADVERLRPFYERLELKTPDGYAPPPLFDDQIDALLAAAPPVISFVMGVPPARVVEETRRRGIVTLGTATTVDEALALEAGGIDVVIASGSDAGGHRGAFLRPVTESLVGTFSLVPQVADAVGVPVLAAGGIADRRGVLAARALGADGVQIGTGFLATTESGTSTAHKAALAGPDARTTVLTRIFSGRHARAILNPLIREMAAAEDQVPPYPVQNTLMRPLRAAAASRNDAAHVNLWAGQAAALSRPIPAADYVESLL